MSQNQAAAPDEFKGRLAPGKNWMEIVAWVGDLPPLPQVASQAIALVEDPETTAGQLTNLLSKDTALAARVLKIANSAMFSRQREITTLSQAIMIIGFKALKGIIVAATLRQLNRKYGAIEKLIWQNSMCTAMAAMNICQHMKKRFVDEAFLLGLLHDLGKLVLIRHAPEDYQNVHKFTQTGITYADAEQQKLGFAHPLIGALVAKKWNFSPETCQVILHHHDPISLPFESEIDEKTVVIQLANLLSHQLGYGHAEGYKDPTEQLLATADLLKLDQAILDKLKEQTLATFNEQSSVFE